MKKRAKILAMFFVDLQDALSAACIGDEIRVAQDVYYPGGPLLPTQASNPVPADGATYVSITADLSWTAGLDATLHDVYFGTSSPGIFQGNQSDTTFNPGTMAHSTKYYWRIDEVNKGGKTIGTVWSFTTISPGPSWPPPPPPMGWSNGEANIEMSVDRSATFQLKNDVVIKGGYAGFGEPDPNVRDIHAYETILCGDMGIPGDDSDNSYHVVTGSGTDETAVLDGFTITAGNANGWNAHNYGGGGMYNYMGSPTVTNCKFSWNSAICDGGGMFNYSSSPIVTNCKFTRNSALSVAPLSGGGGMYNTSSTPKIINCTFSGNWARYGGGMQNWGFSTPTLTNCTLSGNHAQVGGGISFINPPGGHKQGAVVLTNCILWCNRDSSGVDEQAQIWGSTDVNYSCIQGLTGDLGGIGNIEADPRFVDPGYWDANDVWVDGDYRLKSQGWRWHSQRKAWTWDDVTSRCIDAGNPGSLLRDEALTVRVDPTNEWGQNLRINMGAYGGTAQASIPPHGWAILADLTNDGTVDFIDLAHWTEIWLSSGNDQLGDLDRNGIIDMVDFALVARDWRAETNWPPPDEASNPNPADGATGVSTTADLSWTAGSDATSHDVYFGTSSTPPFVGNQTYTTFDPGRMAYSTTYYWRIDEVNKWGKTTGTVWSFTTWWGGGPSDARLKTDIKTLTNVLDKVEKIRGISFEWSEVAGSIGISDGRRQIGVIAQDVEAVFPELVGTSKGIYKGVEYHKLTAVLIEAVKELKAENETLKRRIEVLETKVQQNEPRAERI
ncbi:MAG: tail fiber domain-containing protein [Planctomycetota bacterium]|jgi:hypothetical protein